MKQQVMAAPQIRSTILTLYKSLCICMVRPNFLNSFHILDDRQFRQLDYVLILFLTVTVNEFLK